MYIIANNNNNNKAETLENCGDPTPVMAGRLFKLPETSNEAHRQALVCLEIIEHGVVFII